MKRLALVLGLLVLASCGSDGATAEAPVDGPYRVFHDYARDGDKTAENWLNQEAAQGRFLRFAAAGSTGRVLLITKRDGR